MCSIDDLEDLAANIFEPEDASDNRQVVHKEKMLKRQQRK